MTWLTDGHAVARRASTCVASAAASGAHAGDLQMKTEMGGAVVLMTTAVFANPDLFPKWIAILCGCSLGAFLAALAYQRAGRWQRLERAGVSFAAGVPSALLIGGLTGKPQALDPVEWAFFLGALFSFAGWAFVARMQRDLPGAADTVTRLATKSIADKLGIEQPAPPKRIRRERAEPDEHEEGGP